MVTPTIKTEVVPIFVGQQGTGKSTFGEVLLKALFGEDNVLVTDQFDSTARFNADSADALIICLEEKAQEDKRNTSANLKSRATTKKVRKENKGVDPIFQDSYTDFVLTTNELVPLKFEDRGDQRRFMVMEVDPDFTVKNPQAADVFAKLYGRNNRGETVCKGLIEDKPTIEQFKMDLWENKGNPDSVNYREFPKTDAYHRCFDIPRTTEAVEIESIIKALIPFIHTYLTTREVTPSIEMIEEGEENPRKVYLEVVCHIDAVQFLKAYQDWPDRIALCKQAIFIDTNYNKPYAHSVVERTLYDMRGWFREQGLILLEETNAPTNGFRNLHGKLKHSSTAWFVLLQEGGDDNDGINTRHLPVPNADREYRAQFAGFSSLGFGQTSSETGRVGKRIRFNNKFVYDENGEFETLNELKPGRFDRRSENAQ
jgi:hypothetical protein